MSQSHLCFLHCNQVADFNYSLTTPFFNILVPTTDTTKLAYLLDTLCVFCCCLLLRYVSVCMCSLPACVGLALRFH